MADQGDQRDLGMMKECWSWGCVLKVDGVGMKQLNLHGAEDRGMGGEFERA